MATARDLADQLLRRAADDLTAVEAMVPLDPVADAIVGFHASLPKDLDGADRLTPYAAGLRYDDNTVGGVDRETALRWATAAVGWAGDMVQQEERSEDQISDARRGSPPAADYPLQ